MIELLTISGFVLIVVGLAMPRQPPIIVLIERAIVLADERMHIVEVNNQESAKAAMSTYLGGAGGAGVIDNQGSAKTQTSAHLTIRRALVVGALAVLLIGFGLAAIGAWGGP
jgi:hypothetical protein